TDARSRSDVESRDHQLLDFVRRRQAAARTERTAVERRNGVRIAQHVLDIAVRHPQARGRERAAKTVTGTGAVDAVDRERRRSDLAPPAPGEAAFCAECDAHERGAPLAGDQADRLAEMFLAGERGGN